MSAELNGLGRLLLRYAEDEDVAGVPSCDAGLRYALLFADALVPLLSTEFGVSIGAFNNPKDSGLFFSNSISGAAAKLMSHPVAGGPMLYMGTCDDFAFPSRMAKDTLEPICFEESEIPAYAKVVADHFNKAG